MCTCVCVYGKKGVYFKELAHAIMEAVKFKICRVGLQTKDPSKNWYCSLSSKAFSRWNSLWLRRDWKWKWSCSVLTDSLQPHGLKPVKLLCPWDFPGKNIGVGCHFLLQGIFLTQGSNLGLPCCRQTLYHLSSPEEVSFFFYWSLQLIRWGPPTLWRVICLKVHQLRS